MSNHYDGWKNVEAGLLAWIRTKISGSDEDNSFAGEPPSTFDNTNENWYWWVDVSGGDEPVDEFNVDTPGGCGEWRMHVLFKGVYETRAAAQVHAGYLHLYTPITDTTITGVTRFTARGEPTLGRGIVEQKKDQSTGGPLRVWVLEYPFEVIFQPTVVDGTVVT